MGADAKVQELGLNLTHPVGPIANYVPAVTTGKLVYLSGKGPYQGDGSLMTGKVGTDLSVDEESYRQIARHGQLHTRFR